MLTLMRMSLLVRMNLPVSNRHPLTYSPRVDIELGLQSFRPTPTSFEGPEGEDLIASSAPAVNQVGEGSVSVQRPELQSTLPTTVDAETSLSPALVHGAQTECNEYPRVHTDRAQPALADMESREFRPAANDHL